MEVKRPKKQEARLKLSQARRAIRERSGEAGRGARRRRSSPTWPEIPYVAGLMQKFPQLTADELRAYFAEARTLVQEAQP